MGGCCNKNTVTKYFINNAVGELAKQENLSATTNSTGTTYYTGILMTNDIGLSTYGFDAYVNGEKETVSYTATTGSFYFTDPTNTTVRNYNNIITGDHLWFNPATAGYDLSTTDSITLIYVTS